MTIHVLSEHRAGLGESPFWSASEQALYYIDVFSGEACRWSAAAGVETAKVAERLSFIMPNAEGALIFGLIDGISGLGGMSDATGALTAMLPVEADMESTAVNDARVDAAGRLWFGTVERKERRPLCGLYSWSPDAGLVQHLDGVSVSNGIQFSPDNRTMYYVDSWLQRLDAFDFDCASGTIGNRRTLAAIPEQDGLPDGIDVDAEGFIYVALYGGGRLHRYAPDGRLDRVIPVPVSRPSSCTFGGPDLRTLYITSGAGGSAGPLRDSGTAMPVDPSLEGAVLAIEVDVPGRPSPLFAHPVAALAAR